MGCTTYSFMDRSKNILNTHQVLSDKLCMLKCIENKLMADLFIVSAL